MKRLFMALAILPLLAFGLSACTVGEGFPFPIRVLDDDKNVVASKTFNAEGSCVTVAIPQSAIGDNVQIGATGGPSSVQYGDGCQTEGGMSEVTDQHVGGVSPVPPDTTG